MRGLTSGERPWESSWGSGMATPPQGVVEGPWPKKTKISRAKVLSQLESCHMKAKISL